MSPIEILAKLTMDSYTPSRVTTALCAAAEAADEPSGRSRTTIITIAAPPRCGTSHIFSRVVPLDQLLAGVLTTVVVSYNEEVGATHQAWIKNMLDRLGVDADETAGELSVPSESSLCDFVCAGDDLPKNTYYTAIVDIGSWGTRDTSSDFNWFEDVLLPALVRRRATVIVVQPRACENDLIGLIRRKQHRGRYVDHIDIPAVLDEDEPDERFDYARIKRDIPHSNWMALYQQDPVE